MKTKNVSNAFFIQKRFSTMTRTMHCRQCEENAHQQNIVLLYGAQSKSYKFRTIRRPQGSYTKGFTPHIIRNIIYYYHKNDESLSYVSFDAACGVQACGIVLYGNDNGWYFKAVNEKG